MALQGQHYDASITDVKNARGEPASLEDISWASSDGNVVITPEGDGHQARIDLVGIAAGVIVTVTADGRQGSGVKHVVFRSEPIDVTANNDAVTGTLTLGAALD